MICRFACVKPHILKVKESDYLILEEYDKFIIGLSIYYKKGTKENFQRNIRLTDSKVSLAPIS